MIPSALPVANERQGRLVGRGRQRAPLGPFVIGPRTVGALSVGTQGTPPVGLRGTRNRRPLWIPIAGAAASRTRLPPVMPTRAPASTPQRIEGEDESRRHVEGHTEHGR